LSRGAFFADGGGSGGVGPDNAVVAELGKVFLLGWEWNVQTIAPFQTTVNVAFIAFAANTGCVDCQARRRPVKPTPAVSRSGKAAP